MNRVAPAAVELARQVTALDPEIKAEPIGGPDGFGVTRILDFTGPENKIEALWDALLLTGDKRIHGIHRDDDGVHVVFVGDSRADHRDEFELDAYRILLGDDEPEKKPRRKRSAKSEGSDEGAGTEHG